MYSQPDALEAVQIKRVAFMSREDGFPFPVMVNEINDIERLVSVSSETGTRWVDADQIDAIYDPDNDRPKYTRQGVARLRERALQWAAEEEGRRAIRAALAEYQACEGGVLIQPMVSSSVEENDLGLVIDGTEL